MGSDAAAADDWLRLHAARFCQTVQGTGGVRHNSGSPGCSCSPPDGVANNIYRNRRWLCCFPRWVTAAGRSADGRGSVGRDVYGAPALWLQLDQTDFGDGGWSPIWSAGLRMCSSLSRLSRRPCYDRSRAAGYRQDHRPSGPRVLHARRIATGFEPIEPVPPMTTIFTVCLACESLEDT